MIKLLATLKALPSLITIAIALFLPILAVGSGLLLMLVDEPIMLIKLLAITRTLFAIIRSALKMTEHPKTKPLLKQFHEYKP